MRTVGLLVKKEKPKAPAAKKPETPEKPKAPAAKKPEQEDAIAPGKGDE